MERMARPAGLEPATTHLEGECSIQLSYGRVKDTAYYKEAACSTPLKNA